MWMLVVFLLTCCGYQVYHEYIAKDLYTNKSFVVLDKNIVGDQYDNNVYNMCLKDMQGNITDERVTSRVYYDSTPNTTVVLYAINDNINYTFVKLAYLTYFFTAAFLIICVLVVAL